MQPFGSQAYLLANADASTRRLGRCFSELSSSSEAIATVQTYEQIESVQQAGRSNASRAWRAIPIRRIEDPAPALPQAPAGTTILHYRLATFTTTNGQFRAATPIYRAEGHGPPAAEPGWHLPQSLVAADQDLWTEPVGDRMSPLVTQADRCYVIRFNGERWSRFARFGITPWMIPRDWAEIRITLTRAIPAELTELLLFVAKNYQLYSETALGCRLADCQTEADRQTRRYLCPRAIMRPTVIVEPRFRERPFGLNPDLATDFDALGLADPAGQCKGELHLISIEIA